MDHYILLILIFLSIFVAMFSGAVLCIEDFSPRPPAPVLFSKCMENCHLPANMIDFFFFCNEIM